MVDRPVYESQLKGIKGLVQAQMNYLRSHYSLTQAIDLALVPSLAIKRGFLTLRAHHKLEFAKDKGNWFATAVFRAAHHVTRLLAQFLCCARVLRIRNGLASAHYGAGVNARVYGPDRYLRSTSPYCVRTVGAELTLHACGYHKSLPSSVRGGECELRFHAGPRAQKRIDRVASESARTKAETAELWLPSWFRPIGPLPRNVSACPPLTLRA